MRNDNGPDHGRADNAAPVDQGFHGPRLLEALYGVERDALGARLEHAESCYSMWASVIELALRDYAYVRDRVDRGSLTQHERSKVARIMEHDPREFLEDEWFDRVCGYVGISANHLRDRLASDAPMRFPHHRPHPFNRPQPRGSVRGNLATRQ